MKISAFKIKNIYLCGTAMFLFFISGCSSDRLINRNARISLSNSANIDDVYKNIDKNNFLNALTILERKRIKTTLKSDNTKNENDSSSMLAFLGSRGIGVKQKDLLHINGSDQGLTELEMKLGGTDPDLIKFQNQLNKDTAAISYVVLENSYGAFLILNDSIKFIDFCIPKELVNKTISDVRTRLITPYDKDGRRIPRDEILYKELNSLYEVLFHPFEKSLSGIETIIVIPAGSLQLIPIQALVRDTKKPSFLIENYNFVYTNSFTSLKASLEKSKQTFSLLLYGDPFNSLLSGDDKFPRIPYAGKESAAVHSMLPRSDLFSGNAATEKYLKDNISKYSIVHLATHGYVDPKNPKTSFLLTADSGGEDGIFSISEILATKVNAELVILSACETAVSSGVVLDNNVSGSMAMAFMSSGAESVISSLWSVDDISTEKIMTTFYANYGNKSIGKDFRAAQLELLKLYEYSHPYFWSPFILYGSYL